jgi:hypothetical protein
MTHAMASGPRLRGGDQRIEQLLEQRVQNQGRSVFELLLEDATVQAPATTRVDVPVMGDESGPYPWRPPV